MAKRVYLDTSAYLCVLLGERTHKLLLRELEGSELCSSVLLVLEANRNLIRLSREGALAPTELRRCLEQVESDIGQFFLRELTLDLCVDAWMPVVTTPRSLDLAHLRTALWFHEQEPIARFVSLDQAQLDVAREAGLPV